MEGCVLFIVNIILYLYQNAGQLGSGKTLLLLCQYPRFSIHFILTTILALLGEADILSGQVCCPRSPPDAIASLVGQTPAPEDWVLPGLCAYVPQAAWLRNASIRGKIHAIAIQQLIHLNLKIISYSIYLMLRQDTR